MLMPQLHIDKAVSTDNDLEYIFPDNYSEYDKLDSILQKLMDQKIDSISKLDSIKNNGQHSNPEVVVDRQIETYRRPRSKKKIKHYRHHRRKDEHQYHQYEQTENSYQNDFMSKKAKWVIIITSCLLIFLCLFLVGITLRMAPLIDELGNIFILLVIKAKFSKKYFKKALKSEWMATSTFVGIHPSCNIKCEL